MGQKNRPKAVKKIGQRNRARHRTINWGKKSDKKPKAGKNRQKNRICFLPVISSLKSSSVAIKEVQLLI